MEWKHLGIFGRGSAKAHLVHWSRRCRLMFFSIFSSGGHFVQQSGTILAILVEGRSRNISVKLFHNRFTGLGGEVI